MQETTHIRVGKNIQDVNTREIQNFESINHAKKHSHKNFHGTGKLMRADKLLPKKEK